MKPRELTLSYESARWRARGDGLDVVHAELSGLEALLETALARNDAAVEVRLAFDLAVLPRWLHQYHGHYCNYTLRVPRAEAQP